MLGPLGSIQKRVGVLLTSVHAVVNTLNGELKSFVDEDANVLYGNPSGDAQLTDKELAKIISIFLLVGFFLQSCWASTCTNSIYSIFHRSMSSSKTSAGLL
jgi:hypothetical protein